MQNTVNGMNQMFGGIRFQQMPRRRRVFNYPPNNRAFFFNMNHEEESLSDEEGHEGLDEE